MTSSTFFFFFPELTVSSSYKALSLQHLCVQTQEYKLWPDNPETVSSLGGNSFLLFFSVPENKKTSNSTVYLNGRKKNIQACIYTVFLSMATGHKFMFATITKTHEHQFIFIL